jgi:hypothetical protein
MAGLRKNLFLKGGDASVLFDRRVYMWWYTAGFCCFAAELDLIREEIK